MFFYRPWAGRDNEGGRQDQFSDQLYSQFRFHRWGFGALLMITMVAGVVMNICFLLSFYGRPDFRRLPNTAFLMLAVRDLLVALILIPTAIDWFVVNMGIWGGGGIWCKAAGFFEFTLTFEYALLLVAFAVMLYSRRYGVPLYPMDEDFDNMQHMDEVDARRQPPPVDSFNPNGSIRAPSVANSHASNGRQGGRRSKPPSIIGSESGYRNSASRAVHGSAAQKSPFYVAPNRPGSVTGSMEGRLAAGRMSGGRGCTPQGLNTSRTSTPNKMNSRNQHPPAFHPAPPLPEVDETACSLGDADDLWDAASLDYPGREFDSSSPRGWDFIEGDGEIKEVRYSTWHTWMLCLTWLLALALGAPAASMIDYNPRQRPGCAIPADPYNNPYSSTVDDPGFNLLLSNVIITYMVSAITLVVLTALICFHRMADHHFRTMVKMLITLTVIFIATRSPIDILQTSALIESAQGFHLDDPFEIEYEIILIWLTYLPLILNPIVYFCFLGESRKGTRGVCRQICGCAQDEDQKAEAKMRGYKEEEILAERDNVSRTQETNIL